MEEITIELYNTTLYIKETKDKRLKKYLSYILSERGESLAGYNDSDDLLNLIAKGVNQLVELHESNEGSNREV